MKTRITTLIFVLVLAVCDQATPQKSSPLTVVRTYPLSGAVNVSLSSGVAFEFSTPVVSVGFSPSPYFSCREFKNTQPRAPSTIFTCTPTVLYANTTYTITLTSAKDIHGNTLAAPFRWTFSTVGSKPLTKPDLQVDPTSAGLCTYTNCMFKVTVSNMTSQAAGRFHVQVSYDNGDAHVQAVDGLAGNSFKVLSFPSAWDCLEYDFGFAIQVDATNVVVETDESNNTETGYCYLE